MVVQSQFIEMFGTPDNHPAEYEVKSLGELSECYAGATPSTKVKEYWENGTIPWMSSGEVYMGHVTETESKITESGYKHASTKMVPVHSVVIALAGQGKTRGTVAITEIPLCTNQSLCAIVPSEDIHYEYLYHNLKGRYLELRGMAGDVNGRGGLNLKIVQSIRVIVPPIAEQLRFVRIAQQADKSKFDGLKSQFIEMFGALTSDRRLADVAKIYDGVHQTPHYTSAGIRFISVEDISDIYGSNKYISKEDYDKYKHVPEKGDLIMTRIGTIGQCAVVSKTEPLAYYVSVTLIKPDQEVIDSTYLKYYIESGYGQNELRMRSLLEAFPMKINLNEIGKISLKIPSKEAQLKFVEVVNRADKSKYLS